MSNQSLTLTYALVPPHSRESQDTHILPITKILYPNQSHLKNPGDNTISNDDFYYLTCSRDGSIIKHNCNFDGVPINNKRMLTHSDWVTDIIWGPNMDTFITVSNDFSIVLHLLNNSLGTWDIKITGDHDDYIKAIVHVKSSDDAENFIFATGGLDKLVKVWSLNKLNNEVTLAHTFDNSQINETGSIYCMSSPQENPFEIPYDLIVGDCNGNLIFYSCQSIKEVYRLKNVHKSNIKCMKVLDHSTRLITAGADGCIIIWDITINDGPPKKLGHYKWKHLVWSIYGESLDDLFIGDSSGSLERVSFTDLKKPEMLTIFDPNNSNPHRNHHSEDPNSTNNNNTNSNTNNNNQSIASLNKKTGGILDICVLPTTNTILFSFSSDSNLNKLDLNSKNLTIKKGGFALIRSSLLTNRRHVITENTKGQIQRWDIISCQLLNTFPPIEGSFDEIVMKYTSKEILNHWCVVSIKVGMLFIKLSPRFLNTEIYGSALKNYNIINNIHVNDDERYNVGRILVNSLFNEFISYEIAKDKLYRKAIISKKKDTFFQNNNNNPTNLNPNQSSNLNPNQPSGIINNQTTHLPSSPNVCNFANSNSSSESFRDRKKSQPPSSSPSASPYFFRRSSTPSHKTPTVAGNLSNNLYSQTREHNTATTNSNVNVNHLSYRLDNSTNNTYDDTLISTPNNSFHENSANTTPNKPTFSLPTSPTIAHTHGPPMSANPKNLTINTMSYSTDLKTLGDPKNGMHHERLESPLNTPQANYQSQGNITSPALIGKKIGLFNNDHSPSATTPSGAHLRSLSTGENIPIYSPTPNLINNDKLIDATDRSFGTPLDSNHNSIYTNNASNDFSSNAPSLPGETDFESSRDSSLGPLPTETPVMQRYESALSLAAANNRAKNNEIKKVNSYMSMDIKVTNSKSKEEYMSDLINRMHENYRTQITSNSSTLKILSKKLPDTKITRDLTSPIIEVKSSTLIIIQSWTPNCCGGRVVFTTPLPPSRVSLSGKEVSRKLSGSGNNAIPEEEINNDTSMINDVEKLNTYDFLDYENGNAVNRRSVFEQLEANLPYWFGKVLLNDAKVVKAQKKLNFIIEIWSPHNDASHDNTTKKHIEETTKNSSTYHSMLKFARSKSNGGLTETDLPKIQENNTKLIAPEMIKVKKIKLYIIDRFEGKTPEMRNKTDPNEWLELLCRGKVLDNEMTLNSVKTLYWKSQNDIVIQYRRKPAC